MRTQHDSPRFAVLLLLALAVLGGAAAAMAEDPPPIPSTEVRDAFIRAHQDGIAAGAGTYAPRVAHDEYDVTHYDVSLDLDIPAHVIYGAVEVQATAVVSDLGTIDLDLYSPMVVDSVQADGAPAVFTHAANVISVTLDQPLQMGESVVVRCVYHGTPQYSLTPFRWNYHGASSVPMVLSYSEPYGAPAWWVCKDDPKDKATFSIHVTAPDTLSTVSNGYFHSAVDNGDGTATYNWIHDYPLSTYLFSIATTDFQSWTEVYTALDGITTMNVDYFTYPEDFHSAQVSWSNNIQMMEWCAGLFGEYPFLTEKYALAEFAHPGAMEHQTATSMGAGWINGSNSNDFVVLHELSHSWVGDMITMCEWSHAWTKEGFATYCEALYFEDLYGEAYYRNYMNGMNVLNYAILQLYDINPPLHAAIYYKGAWVLHMLRHVIGDQAFFDAVYDYTNDPDLMYGCSDTEDLRMAFEATSGMDLTWFFNEWIYSPGYPQFVQSWTSAPAGGGYDVDLQLFQVQTVGPTFKMPIDVRIHTDLGQENFVVWDSLFAQSFSFHVAGSPLVVQLDPDFWLIKRVLSGTEVADQGLTPEGVIVLNRPNPFHPSNALDFAVPAAGPVRLRIFDVAGRLTRTLFDRPVGPGRYQVVWDGRNAAGAPAPSGVYYHLLEQNARMAKGRLVLLK